MGEREHRLENAAWKFNQGCFAFPQEYSSTGPQLHASGMLLPILPWGKQSCMLYVSWECERDPAPLSTIVPPLHHTLHELAHQRHATARETHHEGSPAIGEGIWGFQVLADRTVNQSPFFPGC